MDEIHNRINALPWDRGRDDSRYYRYADETETLSGWPYLVNGHLRLTLGRDLSADPTYEQQGRLDFAKIDPGAKWVALTYCVLFRNAVLGVINSQQGPNTPHIAAYLENKGGAPTPLTFRQVARKDVVAQLNRLKWVSKYEISVEPGSLFFPKIGEDSDSPDMERLLQAAATMRDAKIVRLAVESGSKRTPLHGALDAVRRMAQSGSIDTASLREFEVTGPDISTSTLHPVNLLRDFLCATKLVPLQQKALDEEAAFRAIEAAFAENISELPTINIRSAE